MRCECLTIKKKQCTREALRGSKYCKQHADCRSPKKISRKAARSPRALKKQTERLIDELTLLFEAEPVQHEGAAHQKARAYGRHITSRPGLVAAEQVYYIERSHVLPKRIIGQGTYGCVTLPSIPCEGFDEMYYEGLVSKVLNETESKKELNEGKSLSQIDTLISGERDTLTARFRFGVYALDRCSFPLLDESEIQSFDSASNGPCRAGKARALGFVVHMERAEADCSKIHSIVQASTSMQWLRALKNALDGLANMHKHNFYHFDVKPQNMLYFLDDDKSVKTIKINDFGLTCSLDNPLFRESIAFFTPWFNFPPAATIVASKVMYNNVNLEKAIKDATVYFDSENDTIDCINQDVYTKGGILRSAEQWNGSMSKHELASRIDLYGFAMTLDNLYNKVSDDLKPLVSNFCSNITEMKWSTERAVKEYEVFLS